MVDRIMVGASSRVDRLQIPQKPEARETTEPNKGEKENV